jgi:hypothetical protein
LGDIIESIRNIVNKVEALPEDGVSAPDLETFPIQKLDLPVYQVQKIMTEVYVYTDMKGMQYGSKTFQDIMILGEMTKDQIDVIVEAKKRKRKG